MQDMIDFPVSDDWLEHYHKIGLTPHRPPDRSFEEFAWRLEKVLKSFEKRLEILEQNQKMLADALLQRNSQTPKNKTKRKGERKIEL